MKRRQLLAITVAVVMAIGCRGTMEKSTCEVDVDQIVEQACLRNPDDAAPITTYGTRQWTSVRECTRAWRSLTRNTCLASLASGAPPGSSAGRCDERNAKIARLMCARGILADGESYPSVNATATRMCEDTWAHGMSESAAGRHVDGYLARCAADAR